MSNVKEAYELIFVDGTRFPEVVLNSMAGEKIIGFPRFIMIDAGKAPFLITGRYPMKIDEFDPEWSLKR